MKPNPEPILQAAQALGELPERCVLVGDSLSGINGTRAAGVRVIGYANRPGTAKPFQAAGADAVIFSMGQIAGTLLGSIGG